MTDKNDGGPAFPVAEDHRTADALRWTAGMSLRDWFAGQALAGILAADTGANWGYKEAAIEAYGHADAMIADRAK
jgi:hypothetical protein